MKYLKLFETEAEYTAYKSGSNFLTPNISYCEDGKSIFYSPWEASVLPEAPKMDFPITIVSNINNEINESTEIGKALYQYLDYKLSTTNEKYYNFTEDEQILCRVDEFDLTMEAVNCYRSSGIWESVEINEVYIMIEHDLGSAIVTPTGKIAVHFT